MPNKRENRRTLAGKSRSDAQWAVNLNPQSAGVEKREVNLVVDGSKGTVVEARENPQVFRFSPQRKTFNWEIRLQMKLQSPRYF